MWFENERPLIMILRENETTLIENKPKTSAEKSESLCMTTATCRDLMSKSTGCGFAQRHHDERFAFEMFCKPRNTV